MSDSRGVATLDPRVIFGKIYVAFHIIPKLLASQFQRRGFFNVLKDKTPSSPSHEA